MRFRLAAIIPAFASVLALSAPAALAESPGGTQAPEAAAAGGNQYGLQVPAPKGPLLAQFSVPPTVTAGRPPRVSFRIDEAGVGTVDVRVTVADPSAHTTALSVLLGWVHTGRSVSVSWPAKATLAAGSYLVSIRAHDHHHVQLAPGARASAAANLTVQAAALAPPTSPPAAPADEPGVPTPAQTVADGAIFPVQGAHNFGGPENRYGAPREGHIHEGQDVLTSEGTPVVAPLAGTIMTASYQAGGAGYYTAEHTGIGFDFMFAHCEVSSLAVSTGQAVTPGQSLCKAGQTGDATAPHLDFEIWVGGWQAPGGEPINPLPYLQAWEAA
jgi:biotin carboxyl carrier protein